MMPEQVVYDRLHLPVIGVPAGIVFPDMLIDPAGRRQDVKLVVDIDPVISSKGKYFIIF